MVAIDREADVFGVVFLSVITCYGGGLLRDVMVGTSIGRERPWLFLGSDTASLYMILTVATALAVFLIALLFKKHYAREERAVVAINNVLDAFGIGVFAAIGTEACLELGAFVAITMGMVTCVGGGLMRDVILGDIPFILRKYVYAVATIIGSAVYYVVAVVFMPENEAATVVATVSCTLVVFVIRMLATAFKLNLPKAIRFSELKEELEDK
jgi:uncharacterized membrane protein YeiH